MIDINAIVTAVHAAVEAELPGFQVLDGWNRADDVQPQSVAIGHPPTFGHAAVTVDVVEDDAGAWSSRYDVTIFFSAASWDGQMEYTVKRGHVQDLLSGVARAIDDDRQLGGLALEAWVGDQVQLHQIADEQGTVVQADGQITVRVHAS